MTTTYNVKHKILISGIALLGIASLFSVYSVFADTTNALLPSSDGTYLRWMPSISTARRGHFNNVNELTCDGLASYNYTNAAGSRESYGISLAAVPNGSTITAITITPCASKNNNYGSSTTTLGVFYRYNNMDSTVAWNYNLAGLTPTQLAPTTFNGLSLVKNSSSVIQIGAVISVGTNGARLSRIATVITYTPPATTTVATSTTTVATTTPR
ncbi:MAG: hypothetical protein Q7R85_00270 [bacterium]|nr:hypothetical protein [bacterium]